MRRILTLALAFVAWASLASAQPAGDECQFSTTAAAIACSRDVMVFRSVSVYVATQGGSSTVTFEQSNNNVNWVALPLNVLGGGTTTTATTVAGLYQGPITGRFFRLNISGIASGTTAGTVEFSAQPAGWSPAFVSGISCNVAVSAATTLTAVGGSCAAPGAGLSIYITDINFGSSGAASTAADAFPTLKYGTGGTCGTGTVVFWSALNPANTSVVENLTTPIKIPANNEVCWIDSTAGSKVLRLGGFIAP